MKTLSLLLAAMLIFAAMFMLAVPALADAGSAASPEFFTWEMLATYGGALLCTLAVTQITKELPLVKKVPTRIYSWMLAALILLGANLFLGMLTLKTGVLCIFNAVVISLAANGGYDLLSSVKKNE